MSLKYASISEKARQEMLAEPHIAILSISNGDEAPISSPIWYLYEPGGDISIIVSDQSLKARRMAEGVKVSFTVDTAEPTKWVSVEGPVVSRRKTDFEPEMNALVGRYVDDPEAREGFIAGYRPIADEMIRLTIRPERWRGNDLSVDFEV